MLARRITSELPNLATIAGRLGVAVGVTFDPTAADGERWIASVGLDSVAAAPSLFEAIMLATDEHNQEDHG